MRKLLLAMLLASVTLAYAINVSPHSGAFPRGPLEFKCSTNDFAPVSYEWAFKDHASDFWQPAPLANETLTLNFDKVGSYDVRCTAFKFKPTGWVALKGDKFEGITGYAVKFDGIVKRGTGVWAKVTVWRNADDATDAKQLKAGQTGYFFRDAQTGESAVTLSVDSVDASVPKLVATVTTDRWRDHGTGLSGLIVIKSYAPSVEITPNHVFSTNPEGFTIAASISDIDGNITGYTVKAASTTEKRSFEPANNYLLVNRTYRVDKNALRETGNVDYYHGLYWQAQRGDVFPPAPAGYTVTFNGIAGGGDADVTVERASDGASERRAGIRTGSGWPFFADPANGVGSVTVYVESVDLAASSMKAYVGSHQIRLRGTKTLVYSITAKDDEGNSRTANATVRFSNTPPVVNEVSVDCTEGGANTSNCLFSVSARDPDGDPLSYTVYVNSNPRGACLNPPPSDCRTILMGNKTSARVLFGLRGEHAAVFEVTDRKSTVSLETNFTIANLAPTAAFVAPTCREGRECGFDAAPSSDDGSIASYLWLFGDGTNSTLSAPFHNYSAAGDYTVTLKVKDDEGAASSVSKQVHVQRLAVDQSSGESNDGFFQFGPSGAGLVAQQFVPSFSTVDAVRVFMWNNKGAVNISIRDSLDGDELWEVTVPFSELNSSGFTTISLNDSLSVTGGSTYYIVAEPVLYLGDLDNFRAYYVSPGNYDAGEPWVFVSGSGWQREGNDRDLNFETAYWI